MIHKSNRITFIHNRISEVVDRAQFFALKIRAIPFSENQAQSVRSGETPGSVKGFKHGKNLESVGTGSHHTT